MTWRLLRVSARSPGQFGGHSPHSSRPRPHHSPSASPARLKRTLLERECMIVQLERSAGVFIIPCRGIGVMTTADDGERSPKSNIPLPNKHAQSQPSYQQSPFRSQSLSHSMTLNQKPTSTTSPRHHSGSYRIKFGSIFIHCLHLFLCDQMFLWWQEGLETTTVAFKRRKRQ